MVQIFSQHSDPERRDDWVLNGVRIRSLVLIWSVGLTLLMVVIQVRDGGSSREGKVKRVERSRQICAFLRSHHQNLMMIDGWLRIYPQHESRSVVSDSLRPVDSTVHGILQARTLEWVAVPFSRGSSQSRDQTQVSCIASGFLPAEPPGKPMVTLLV